MAITRPGRVAKCSLAQEIPRPLHYIESGGFVEVVRELIGTMGFPIAAFLLLYFDNRQERVRRDNEAAEWRKIISHNTEIIEQLKGVLENGK